MWSGKCPSMDVGLIANATNFTSFVPLAWILLTPKNAVISLAGKPNIAAKGKVAIVNPAREKRAEKLQKMMTSFQRFSSVWLFSSSLIGISHKRFVRLCACLASELLQIFENSTALTPAYAWSQLDCDVTQCKRSSVNLDSSIYPLNHRDLNLHGRSSGHFNMSGTGDGDDDKMSQVDSNVPTSRTSGSW